MKKFAIFTLTLSLCCALLVGCGCMNSKAEVPTLPTNGEAGSTTHATQAPTTQPTTIPTTQPSSAATDATVQTTGPVDGTMDGAMDEIMGGSADDATGITGPARGRSGMIPRG